MRCSASRGLAILRVHNQDVALLPMNERYIKWYTPYLSRQFEMLVFGDKGGLPLILFPTSGARYYENKDFGLVGAVAWYIDNGRITICCPDSIDLESFYNKSIHPADRMRTHNAYENVIIHDVFDLARGKCFLIGWAFAGAGSGPIPSPTMLFVIPTPSVFLSALTGRSDSTSSST